MVTKTIKVKGGEFAVEPDGRLRPIETHYGMSEETKPIEGVKDADCYLERDTGSVFIFDETGKQWLPV